jgi:hypothetical protein
MRSIFKYQLHVGGVTHQIPAASSVRYLGRDPSGEPCAWVELDPDNTTDRVTKEFTVFGTGHLIPDDAGEYVGTFVESPFVWHVYWRTL